MILSGEAKNQLLDLIKRRGKISPEEAATELRLAKSTVRQHLLSMENQNLVTRLYERAGQGRPKVSFQLAAAGRHLYPTKEPALLRELVDFLLASERGDLLQKFFEAHWAECRRRFEAVLAARPEKKKDLNVRLRALSEFLQAEGFMPEIERSRGCVTVRECHCPFAETIRSTRLPCRLESEFIKWALKTPMRRTQYIPNGDFSCSYRSR